MAASSTVQLETEALVNVIKTNKELRLCSTINASLSYILVNMKGMSFSISTNFIFRESTVAIHFHIVFIPL